MHAFLFNVFTLATSFLANNALSDDGYRNLTAKKILPISVAFIGHVECYAGQQGITTCPSGPTTPVMQATLAIPLAQNAINSNPKLWPFHNMTVNLKNTYGFPKIRLRDTLSEIKSNSIAIFELDNKCDDEAAAADRANKLLISAYCTTSNRYTTFLQFQGAFWNMASAAVEFIEKNGWKRVTVVYFSSLRVPDMPGLYDRLNSLLLEKHIITIKSYTILTATKDLDLTDRFLPSPTMAAMFAKLLTESFLLTRVYVVLSSDVNGADAHYLLDTMGRMGLLQTGEYAVLNMYSKMIQANFDGSLQNSQYFIKFTRIGFENIPLLQTNYNNYRSVALFTEYITSPASADFQIFSDMIKNISRLPPCPLLCNFRIPRYSMTTAINQYTAMLYESIMQFAMVVTKMIESDNTAIADGREMMKYFSQLHVNESPATGIKIQLNDFGEAFGSFKISTATFDYTRRPSIMEVGVFQSLDGESLQLTMNDNASFNWINGKAPLGSPKCGFDGKLCPAQPDSSWIIGSFVALLTVLLFGLSIYFYKKRRYERQLRLALWKILKEDLVIHNPQQQQMVSASFGSGINDTMESVATTSTRQKIPWLQQTRKEFHRNIKMQSHHQLTSKRTMKQTVENKADVKHAWEDLSSFSQAFYKGQLVGLKRVYKTPTTEIDRATAKELLAVTLLAQENLNRLLGVVYETSDIFLVSEYCQKGNLKDMLENDSMHFDHLLLASVVFDIIKGISYLQSTPLGCHGRLKSTNCLIDSRWLIRLSEFGLFHFLEDEQQPLSEEEKCKKLLWMAPEALRGNTSNYYRTAAGDVYAFGIILHEIFGRQGPFGDNLMEPTCKKAGRKYGKIIIQKVKYPQLDEPLYRPDMLKVYEAPDYVRKTMQKCWDEKSECRPSFNEIKEKLQPLKEGLSTNMLDNMMNVIETYNNNLEGLIVKRTTELHTEKMKADSLLSAMLPKEVGEALRQGHLVEPEHFDSVTVYFSDIVGFANIMHHSTPYQVVNFLHHIYATFDSMISKYDVYKVETIGDAYMVVSGLPIRNGDKHAAEIASMALNFVKAAKERKVRQPSGDLVQLRVGINSGPCVAGIVGLKMPRYCLFGDTVNTASRMESNGQPLKIHCSGSCKAILDLHAGFEIVERGLVAMKGLEEQLTYWLMGEDAVHRQKRLAQKK